MGRCAVIDGAVLEPEQAKVSVYDRGFLYGDSVFETVRTYAGRPFALDEHLERLERSADVLGIRCPVSRAALASEIEVGLRVAGNRESLVRIVVSRGSGPLGLDAARALAPLRVVLVEPLELPPAAYYRDGISVACCQTVRASDCARSAKLSNYVASVLALREARAAGADEALVVNREGLVVEATTANVFFVPLGTGGSASELATPPLEAGVLAGITRAKVLAVARELGHSVRELAVAATELQRAREVFLTSSVREILPVVRVDGVAIGDGRPGPLTRKIHVAFRVAVGLGHGPMPWQEQD